MHYSVCDMILDLVQNSIEAEAARISLTIYQKLDVLRIELEDDGKGMDKETLERAKDPFYTDGIKHKSRKVGLGIPFLIQTIEQTDGSYTIATQKGEGCRITFEYRTDHIDSPPFGDLVSTIISMFLFDSACEIFIERIHCYKQKSHSYQISKHELMDVLQDFHTIENLSLLGQYIRSAEEELIEGE